MGYGLFLIVFLFACFGSAWTIWNFVLLKLTKNPKYLAKYDDREEKFIVFLGFFLAAAASWYSQNSIFWIILHGMMNYFYVLYWWTVGCGMCG